MGFALVALFILLPAGDRNDVTIVRSQTAVSVTHHRQAQPPPGWRGVSHRHDKQTNNYSFVSTNQEQVNMSSLPMGDALQSAVIVVVESGFCLSVCIPHVNSVSSHPAINIDSVVVF